MPRELRPRKNRPSYLALAGYLDEEEENRAGPSSAPAAFVEDDEDSESDFAPEKSGKDRDEDEEEEDEDAVGEVDDDAAEGEVIMTPISPGRKREPSKAKGKMKAESTVKSVGSMSRRQMYALPTPSLHHRHKAVPLFSRVGRVERLISSPKPFATPSVSLANGFTQTLKVADRVIKSWGYNVGSGPLWDLAEDRGWFGEAATSGTGLDSEGRRRPMVYQEVAVRQGWKILTTQEATAYLPTDDVTTEEGVLKPPPPVPCSFGPIKSQKRHDLDIFESVAMSTYSPESNAHVFNAGAPVWGVDWCPTHPGDRAKRGFKQYLAVAPFSSHSHSPDIGKKVARPSYACIQIWSLSSIGNNTASKKSLSKKPDSGQMKCEMVICLDTGPAYDIKWCPLPSHDSESSRRKPRKLGLLAGTFEDGSFAIFVVPDPKDVKPRGHDDSTTVYVNLSRPILRIELEETACWSFDWANSHLVAIGTTNGCIAVYDILDALKSCADGNVVTVTDILPTHYLTVHQSAIRSLAWIRAPPSSPSGAPCTDQDPTTIASGGYDGMECMTDIREGRGVVMNRTRDVINALVFSPFSSGPITLDHENTVKAYSASPSTLARGHSLIEPQGPVWSIHASDYHPQLAVGAADGSCSTTNTLRATRRGGSAPIFVHKIFQMDYNRNTKEFRMLDHFLPQESLDRPTARSTKGKGKKDDQTIASSTGAWPREVGVHRVVWNNGNGLAACGWLAAGTASGLCRVDLLWGRWSQDKIPYGGIEGIRFEDEDAMEVDTDGSNEESG